MADFTVSTPFGNFTVEKNGDPFYPGLTVKLGDSTVAIIEAYADEDSCNFGKIAVHVCDEREQDSDPETLAWREPKA